MSWQSAEEPEVVAPPACKALQHVIVPRPRDLGGFEVRRVLPAPERHNVGPFVFFDQIGPAELAPGAGIDVRPHPHIGLATVTYLFAGTIIHRDSLGTVQAIEPGEVNWMTAGRGIAHSERTPPELRAGGSPLHGIQLWVALPTAHEETAPAFHHHDANALPALELDGVRLRVLIGSAFGASSPVETFSPMFYVEAIVPAGAALPVPDGFAERGAYVVEGALSCGAERVDARHLALFAAGSSPVVRAERASRVMLIGGEPLDGPRHIWWNFVSSRAERIEEAKRDWAEGRFPTVPGDEIERIPLP